MSELAWIAEGRKLIGTIENTSKTSHNPVVIAMWESIEKATGKSLDWLFAQGLKNLHNKNDEVAWCGGFVGACLARAGRHIVPNPFRASAWNDYREMTQLTKPCYGCIVTFTRDGGGHVGFVVGKDKAGNLMVLGGNQSNKVSIIPFAVSRATGYFFPSKVDAKGNAIKAFPVAYRYDLPLLKSNGQVSTNEA